jgi:hypothetical protein
VSRRALQVKVSRIYFRADAAFANTEVYAFLEAERIRYAIWLPANQVLQDRIDRLSAHAPRRTTSERGPPVPCQFQLSGRKLDEAAPGDRQSGMASWRALSARRVHRDEHEPPPPKVLLPSTTSGLRTWPPRYE